MYYKHRYKVRCVCMFCAYMCKIIFAVRWFCPTGRMVDCSPFIRSQIRSLVKMKPFLFRPETGFHFGADSPRLQRRTSFRRKLSCAMLP